MYHIYPACNTCFYFYFKTHQHLFSISRLIFLPSKQHLDIKNIIYHKFVVYDNFLAHFDQQYEQHIMPYIFPEIFVAYLSSPKSSIRICTKTSRKKTVMPAKIVVKIFFVSFSFFLILFKSLTVPLFSILMQFSQKVR